MARVVSAMGYVVGKKVAPPEGTAVVWEVRGPVPVSLAARRARRAGRVVDERPPADATVRLDLDDETFWRLGCGRVGADEALASGEVQVTGDAELATGSSTPWPS